MKRSEKTEYQRRMERGGFAACVLMIGLWAFCCALYVLRAYGYFC